MSLASLIVSILAFIVSAATGSIAVYLTWTSSRETTVDNIGKLIDQYYVGQEKLAALHEDTQLPRINILRSQLQIIASRTVALEKLVLPGDIDDGTRLAVAQINDSLDDNLKNAETAWLSAIQNTKDISVYMYAMRNLASNQWHQHRKSDAEQSYQSALDAAASAGAVKGTAIVNGMSDDAKFSQAALTHAFWLDVFGSKDCPFVVPHFDSALRFIADASRTGPRADVASQRRIVSARVLLYRFRETRKVCAPSSLALESEDNCNLIANILDNAPAGFTIYKEVLDKAENRSRIFLPETEFCGIDSNSIFYCTWPESAEARTKMQFDKVVGVVSACKNLGEPRANPSDYALPKEQVKNLDFPDRVNIKIKREESRAVGTSALWRLRLEIDPKVQK